MWGNTKIEKLQQTINNVQVSFISMAFSSSWSSVLKSDKTKLIRTNQNESEQSRTKQNKSEQSRTKQNKAEQIRTKQNEAEQSRTNQNKLKDF